MWTLFYLPIKNPLENKNYYFHLYVNVFPNMSSLIYDKVCVYTYTLYIRLLIVI